MALMIEQFICREDNFGVLIHDPDTGLTASIDAPDAAAIGAHLARRHWKLDRIFTTHHHADHTDGNLALKAEYGCRIVAPGRSDIPGRDEIVGEGDGFTFGTHEVRVLATPGHTLDHVTFWIPGEGVAFVGDTLFAIGCGRVIEGTMPMMWASLEKLMQLPDDTDIYCGHEYTETNARFALTVDPGNADLVERAKRVRERRAAGQPTLPTTVVLEKQTNPFLRAADPAIRAHLGMKDASNAEVFGEIRRRKDGFR
ncbi:MAG TPA: hydroxyacylglutathione hydrolase [Bauldia sp.]|nr:hydroxyacylglutathione hydrolase [Bauldia sp.]